MPTQTPASRKFIPPPSTGSVRTQRHSGFSSQFARPSQYSSSPFNRTPFASSTQKQKKDEIELDQSEDEEPFEDGTAVDDPPVEEAPSQQEQFEPVSSIIQSDSLDDPTQTTQFYPTQRRLLEDTKLPDIPTIKRRKISHHHISDTIDDEPNSPSPPSSPTHSHNGDHPSTTAIQVRDSSPPTPNSTNRPPIHQRHISSPTSKHPHSPLAHHPKTPTTTHSRFRDRLLAPNTSTHSSTPPLPNNIQTQQHQQQAPHFPSFQSRLLASSSSSISTTSHPNFSTLSGPHLQNPQHQNHLETTLPDAFSPSRKRGQREYIYGGYAETVRGWVVDLATRAVGNIPTRQVRQYSEGTQSGGMGSRKVVVDRVLLNDPSRRFILIQTTSSPSRLPPSDRDVEDSEGAVQQSSTMATTGCNKWMLINTDPQQSRNNTSNSRSNTSSDKLAAIRSGVTVLVKGAEHMTWDLDVYSPSKGEQGRAYSGGDGVGGQSMCKVTVLWEGDLALYEAQLEI